MIPLKNLINFYVLVILITYKRLSSDKYLTNRRRIGTLKKHKTVKDIYKFI